MRSNRINDDDDQLVKEAVHWMVITAAYDPSLRAVKDKFADELARNDDVNMLKKLGCDKDKLLSTLAFANRMPALYPPLGADPLRDLARDLKSVLVRMKRLTPSRALPWFEHSTQEGKYILTFEPTGGDLHVWPELERELQRKAAAYEGLAGLCQKRKIPSRATFRKYAFLWPVQYINSCLGEPHYSAAARLLCLTGIQKDRKHLKVAFVSADPSVLRWLELATSFIHDTGGSRPK